jgi:hypothetical protein
MQTVLSVVVMMPTTLLKLLPSLCSILPAL